MNYEFYVEYRPKNEWWAVVRRDILRDGLVNEYTNDILDNEDDALLSARASMGRHILWDHYEALKVNEQYS